MTQTETQSMTETIEAKLTQALACDHLEVINESHMHNVAPGSQSHFKLIIVAGRFAELRLVARHQLVNSILADELKGAIHALSLRTLTPAEWAERGGETPASPPCLGGGKDGN